MNEEIKEILDKLSNRKQETLIQGLRECQLKDIEHPFITREEYIDKILDYITNIQQENERLKKELKKKTSRCTERNHKIRCRDRKIERRDKKISKLEQRIDKATNYYLHKLNEQGSMPDEAVKMFYILEGNIHE